jgi:hypothetical protein
VRGFRLRVSPFGNPIRGGKLRNNSAFLQGLADLLAEVGISFRPRG